MSDVRRLPYMPLQIERLRRSKAWLRCKRRPELAFYLMNLWMRAWHELPAGSIEADDDVLADAAMCDPLTWEEIRHDVLKGWELVDGRYHHPTVTELAAEAATKLKGNVGRTEAAREARATRRRQDSEAFVTEAVTDPVTDDEEKGREAEGNKEESPAQHLDPAGQGGAALPDLEASLRRAADVELDPAPAWRNTAPIAALVAEGFDLDREILPVIRARKGAGRSWTWFVGPIRDARKAAGGPPAAASSASAPGVYVRQDSDEGRAWDRYEAGQGRKIKWLPSGRDLPGKTMPSAFPPS